ncbi:hypothetical protein [Actinomadura hibisca]|uniref:hypothetical protein n=1 Tax=Actinomadura hibisca TaxID=68565 RepID=UPI00082C9F8B|nr:hypothetical protein [Actinomadura hibisca]
MAAPKKPSRQSKQEANRQRAAQRESEALGLPPQEFRPPRRMLVWVVPCLLVCVAMVVVAVVYRGYGRFTLFGFGIVGALYYVRLASLLVNGFVRVGPTGMVHKLHSSEREAKWKQVRGLEVVTTPFGRRVMVRMGGAGAAVPLAALREGLLARSGDFDAEVGEIQRRKVGGNRLKPTTRAGAGKAAVVAWPLAALLAVQLVELPWQEPWWPTNKDAAALPHACAAVDAGTVRQMVPGAVQSDEAHLDREPFQTSGCRWAEPGRVAGLDLSLHRYSSEGMSGGVANAKDRMLTYSRSYDSTPVSGLGDAAWQIARPADSTTNNATGTAAGSDGTAARNVQLAARRRNVVVIVGYTAPASDGRRAEERAAAVARAALSRVWFG